MMRNYVLRKGFASKTKNTKKCLNTGNKRKKFVNVNVILNAVFVQAPS
uniref:Uncharacterized protein n=1 Tax=Anguilla anguilla TaxID=7936 RepID=A0A0E9WY98_ANGAN